MVKGDDYMTLGTTGGILTGILPPESRGLAHGAVGGRVGWGEGVGGVGLTPSFWQVH